jgi:hypothetical protein
MVQAVDLRTAIILDMQGFQHNGTLIVKETAFVSVNTNLRDEGDIPSSLSI